MDKGFIHVLEAILVAIILLVTLPFLIFPVQRDISWDVARLERIGEDVLQTLDGIGYDAYNESFLQDIMEKNTSNVDNEIQRILGKPVIGYSMTARGVVRNQVRVGCNCTVDEARALEQYLTDPHFNDRFAIIQVFPFSYTTLSRVDFDVILLNGSEQVKRFADFYAASSANRSLVKEHLARNRGIVEFFDPDTTSRSTSAQSEIFGLATGTTAAGDVVFKNNNETSKLNYQITRIFGAIGFDDNFTSGDDAIVTLRNVDVSVRKNYTDGLWQSVDIDRNVNGTYDEGEYNFSDGENFTITFGDGYTFDFKVDKIHNASGTAHFNFNDTRTRYTFKDFVSTDPAAVAPAGSNSNRTVVETAGGQAGMIINATGRGRTAWLSAGQGDDVRALLKSAVVWAAGDEWRVAAREVSGRRVSISYFVQQGEETSEPYWIELILWFLF